jgi:choline dehydrogenase-like flavoprotein
LGPDVNTTFAPGSPSVLADIPDVVDCDFCIIGSGMGGATLALALRDSGAKVLVLEQGDFLPIELQNWDVKAIHLEGRYKNSEPWVNAMGHEYVPATYHYVGGDEVLRRDSSTVSRIRFRRRRASGWGFASLAAQLLGT